MINYKDPNVETILTPIALDKAIASVQDKLSNLTWLDKAFGRCTPQKGLYSEAEAKQYGRKEYIYPEVYYKREPIPLMVNDNLKSFCFFHAKDPMTFVDYEPIERTQIVSQPIAIIFWMNLQKIDSSKQFNFSEELRFGVLSVLKKTSMLIESSSMQFDKVFEPFTINETFRPYIKPPYAAFRIDGSLTFDYFDCPSPTLGE